MSKAAHILAALGGAENIIELKPCTTRLRAELRDPQLLDAGELREAGAHGVIRGSDAIQVVVGLDADALAEDIGALLATT